MLSLLATFINFSELFKDKNIIMMVIKIIGTIILILGISVFYAFTYKISKEGQLF